MIKAVLFDLDGTLLDTLTDLAASCNYALAEMGLPTHPVDRYKYFVGDGKDMLIRRALGDHCTQEHFERADALYSDHYRIHGEDCTLPYDGVLPLLDRLSAAGIACAVISNKPHHFCEPLVPKYFGDRIHPALGHLPGTPPKPDPHRALQAMEELGVAPQEVVYVGDTGVDMQTGKRAGLTTAGVLWGFREEKELRENGADHICQTTQALGDLIFSL